MLGTTLSQSKGRQERSRKEEAAGRPGKVEADLANYLPKLRPGGYLVFDDIGWTTIRPLYGDLKTRMRLVYQAQDVWACLKNE